LGKRAKDQTKNLMGVREEEKGAQDTTIQDRRGKRVCIVSPKENRLQKTSKHVLAVHEAEVSRPDTGAVDGVTGGPGVKITSLVRPAKGLSFQ